MIESTFSPSISLASNSLHTSFLVLMPQIENHARFHFRDIRCADTKADKISETIALAFKWFVRLTERRKNAANFAAALARYAVRAVRSGRRACGQDKANDVFSKRAQRRHGFHVEALPVTTSRAHERLRVDVHRQRLLDVFEDRLRENSVTPIPEQVSFRVDFPDFLARLSERDRRLAEFLSLGHSAKAAAQTFGVSPARVTQIRQKLSKEWTAMQDAAEPEPAGAVRI